MFSPDPSSRVLNWTPVVVKSNCRSSGQIHKFLYICICIILVTNIWQDIRSAWKNLQTFTNAENNITKRKMKTKIFSCEHKLWCGMSLSNKKQANGEKVAMEKNRCNDWKNRRNINVNRRAVRKVESAVLQHFFLTDTGWLTTENEYVGNTKRRLRLETLSDKQVAGTYHETKKPTTVGKNNAECN